MVVFLVLAIIAAFVFYGQRLAAMKDAAAEKARADAEAGRAAKLEQALEAANRESKQNIQSLRDEIEGLAKFKDVRDASVLAEQLRTAATNLKAAAEKEAEGLRLQAQQQANELRKDAERDADQIRKAANLDAKEKRERIEALLLRSNQQAEQIIAEANQRAEQIAGDAYRALKEVDQLQETATAMRNVIDGYGDKYLKPTYSLLDELADAYGFDEAGQQLKQARERSQLMVETGRAASCDYVEKNRRQTAIRFVIDAFNGKVDSILSRTKADNYGTLERQIQDACALVNNNGAAFRDARITPEYLASRIGELRWATAVQALRERDKEEQRAIRDQMREEEKARREIERALKDAAKEEEALQRAYERVQEQVAKANDAQRAKFEAELDLLRQKLAEAEERNKRALSMAQQTRAGHVYVISNVGSFGESVFKVGMTRRLEPMDRVRELGDASVPFGFDVHAMIWSEDAPTLERALHKEFVKAQVNKVNPRKEFFRLDLAELRSAIEARGVEVSWTMAAAAREYRESIVIEQRMRDNPEMAEDWLRHQAVYNQVDLPVMESEDA